MTPGPCARCGKEFDEGEEIVLGVSDGIAEISNFCEPCAEYLGVRVPDPQEFSEPKDVDEPGPPAEQPIEEAQA